MTVYNPTRSIAEALGAEAQEGFIRRGWNQRFTPAASSGGSATSGYQLLQRVPETITVPAVGANVTDLYMQSCKMTGQASGVGITALEFQLGQFTIGTGFAGGVTMPSRRWSGKAVAAQLCSQMPVLWISTNHTGGTQSTYVITYTNQAGVGSRTATIGPLPVNALAGGAYLIAPYLQSGDYGIQSVQNMTQSGQNAGVARVMGLIPVAMGMQIANMAGGVPVVLLPNAQVAIAAGDTLAGYRMNSTSSAGLGMSFVLAPATV